MDPSLLLASLGTSGIPLLVAFSLGLLMAISPCTLATSVAAVIFIAGDTREQWRFIVTGGLYTLGRLVVYVGMAFLIVWFGLNTRETAVFFQQYGERLVAPVLIIAGLWLLGLLPVSRLHWPVFHRISDRVYHRLLDRGRLSAFLLGAFFSLSFCPINVVIFFGLLIPLAYRAGDPLAVPAIFSLASTLPVLAASFLLATGTRHAGRALTRLQDVNLWMQRAAGVVFLVVGVYYLPRFLGI
jgi:cytochrome c-type biogenesis protein